MKISMNKNEKGTSIIEVLVMLSFAAILGLGLTYSLIMSYRSAHKNAYHSAAMQLAIEKLEELKGVDPTDLTSADNQTESNVAVGQMRFTRVSTISVNTDRSRSVLVTVTSNNDAVTAQATISDIFALWGTT